MSTDSPAGNPAANPAGDLDGAAPDALTSDDSCGIGKLEAKFNPLNMFVMFDRSVSMNDDSKWASASAALTSFFREPGLGGMRVALRFFPHDEPVVGCTAAGCDPLACEQALVPLGELSTESGPMDAQELALVDAVASSAPGDLMSGGGTPIHAALDGALRWATSYKKLHPDETTVVVFVTDGEPNGCDFNFDHIAELANQARQKSVTTYAIGLQGSNASQMNQLAKAGGTVQAIFIDIGESAEQQLFSALNTIRGLSLSCKFPMPEPIDPGMAIDPTKINVTFRPGTGDPGTFAQVPDENSCFTRKSWFYDVPEKPTRIELCPLACDLLRDDPKGTIEILLGCATACGGLDANCDGGAPPPAEVPPVLF